MTCIVGLECSNGVIIGGNSSAVVNDDLFLATTPKVFRLSNMIIGYTWSFRMGQIIQHVRDVPKILDKKSNDEYLVTDFVPFIRNIFKEAGWLKIENSQEEGGQFLLGIRGEIYNVQSNFSVLRYHDGFCAVGSGRSYAYGALRVIKNQSLYADDPKLAAGIALETAAYYCSSVSPPFIFEELTN